MAIEIKKKDDKSGKGKPQRKVRSYDASGGAISANLVDAEEASLSDPEAEELRRELREGDAAVGDGMTMRDKLRQLFESSDERDAREKREKKADRDEAVQRAKSRYEAPTTREFEGDMQAFNKALREYKERMSIIEEYDGKISPEALDALLDERAAWREGSGKPTKIYVDGVEMSSADASKHLREGAALRQEKGRLTRDKVTADDYRARNAKSFAQSVSAARAYADEFGIDVSSAKTEGGGIDNKKLLEVVNERMTDLAHEDPWEKFKSDTRDTLNNYYTSLKNQGWSSSKAQAATLAKAGKFGFLFHGETEMMKPVDPRKHLKGGVSVKALADAQLQYALDRARWEQQESQRKLNAQKEISAKLDFRRTHYADMDKHARAAGYLNTQYGKQRARTERDLFISDYDRAQKDYDKRRAAHDGNFEALRKKAEEDTRRPGDELTDAAKAARDRQATEKDLFGDE